MKTLRDGWLVCCAMAAGVGMMRAESAGAMGNDQGGKMPGDGLKVEVVRHYAGMAHATYCDALTEAEMLRCRVHEFLEKPSDESLAAAREAWIKARKPYLQSEAFRFYEGPIDQLEGKINGWPIDESYIDYVQEDADAGIINHPERHPKLSAEVIFGLNEKEGEKSISTGYHAIEFLLWGQDLDPNGPGRRPVADYVVGSGAKHVERRREYLRIVTEMLVSDLRGVVAQWSPGSPNNYRAWFEASAPHQSLRKILHGVGALSSTELAGERLTVAYETKEQEDEHSCFSDTTAQDVVYDTLGIWNVCSGTYQRTDGSMLKGPGLCELLRAAKMPAQAEGLWNEAKKSHLAAAAIPQPFDRAIQGTDGSAGRVAIHHAIQALQEQAVTIAKVAGLVGVRDSE